jgi:hypothetical protein
MKSCRPNLSTPATTETLPGREKSAPVVGVVYAATGSKRNRQDDTEPTIYPWGRSGRIGRRQFNKDVVPDCRGRWIEIAASSLDGRRFNTHYLAPATRRARCSTRPDRLAQRRAEAHGRVSGRVGACYTQERRRSSRFFKHGRIAQLGERGPYKAEVAGSIPAPPTT